MAKILLVEDHDTLGFALQAYLEMKGFEVLWSKDGDSGLRAFEKHPVDLCIVDVGLPGRDGFSLAREIRRQSAKQPLIFLTARALKADRLKGFDLGADDYPGSYPAASPSAKLICCCCFASKKGSCCPGSRC